MINLLGRVLGCGFFHFTTLNILCHCPWSAEFLLKSHDCLMGVPLYTAHCFSLAALKVLFLSSILAIVSITYLCVDLFGFILFGTFYASWAWVSVSFPRLRKVLATISSNKFSATFPLSSPSGTSIMWMLLYLMLSQKSLKLLSFKKNFFFLFRLGGFLYFAFQFSDPCLCIISSTVVSSSVYFTLVIIFFLSVSLYFLSLCSTSHSVHSFSWVHWTSLWWLFLTLYGVDSYLHFISSFSEALSYSFVWTISPDPHFAHFSVFSSYMFIVLLTLLILEKWPYVANTLAFSSMLSCIYHTYML